MTTTSIPCDDTRNVARHLGSAAARPWSALVGAWARWRARMEQRRLARELAWLDPHLLRDVGLSDAEIVRVAWVREQREHADQLWLQGAGTPPGRWNA